MPTDQVARTFTSTSPAIRSSQLPRGPIPTVVAGTSANAATPSTPRAARLQTKQDIAKGDGRAAPTSTGRTGRDVACGQARGEVPPRGRAFQATLVLRVGELLQLAGLRRRQYVLELQSIVRRDVKCCAWHLCIIPE